MRGACPAVPSPLQTVRFCAAALQQAQFPCHLLRQFLFLQPAGKVVLFPLLGCRFLYAFVKRLAGFFQTGKEIFPINVQSSRVMPSWARIASSRPRICFFCSPSSRWS